MSQFILLFTASMLLCIVGLFVGVLINAPQSILDENNDRVVGVCMYGVLYSQSYEGVLTLMERPDGTNKTCSEAKE